MSGQSTPKTKTGSFMVSQSSFNIKSSPSKFRFKKKKGNQLALIRRGLYRVYDNDGSERTPKLLYDSDYQVLEDWQPTVLDYVETDLTTSMSQMSIPRSFAQGSTLAFGSRQQQQQQQSVSLQMSFTNISNVDSYKEQTKTLDGDIGSDTRSEERTSEAAPSAFRLKNLPSREFYPPHSKIPLIAKETNSFTLFSMNSVVQSSESEEADSIIADNEYYEYITTGKGKYTRKLNSSEQQTSTNIKTSESSYCARIPTKNGCCWVTLWKLYDELAGATDEKKNTQGIPAEEQWALLAEDDRFITRGIIMDRILGAPIYRNVQLAYKNSLKLNPMDLEIRFSYSAKKLWMYDTPRAQKKPVVAIAVNKKFPTVIAIGHGKFLYNETDKGYIVVWTIKNPKHPERFYKFPSSVKCLDFAEWTPNLLAAGFSNGDLLILDVSSVEKKVIYSKDSLACDSYERVIFTKWWIWTNIFGKKDERVMITTGDGRIIQFRRKLDSLIPFQMMRITKTEGKVKGIQLPQKCEAEEISMIRFPAARAVVRYPNDHQFYLVSADDGTVHKCSINFFTQHVESFLAHSGPVYALKFSPFCNKIFLTCGADGAVRLWVWDIFEPVITLTLGPEAVEDAAWSPRNSTIIASISETNLYLWDLRRKTYHPASTLAHPEKLKFSSIQFTETGDNIFLGDIEGSVYVMALHGMPFEEKFKEDILAASIEKELVVKPKLLKMLKKTGERAEYSCKGAHQGAKFLPVPSSELTWSGSWTSGIQVSKQTARNYLNLEGFHGGFRFQSNASAIDNPILDFDLISSHPCPTPRRTPSPVEMGQKPSSLWSRPKISLTWALKGDIPIISNGSDGKPFSQERKQSKKNCNSHLKQKTASRMSESKTSESPKHEDRRSVSPTSSTSTRLGRRRRVRRPRPRAARTGSNFGYEIQDVDEFLTKASLDSPGNIPMVLSRPCVLYETHTGGPQREVALPLGMVVNGVLKNRAWLYAQTPHGEEGYVPYACCLPLGILPAPSRPQPCWDTQTDIFPRPSGNKTDREKLKDDTLSEYGSRSTTNIKRIRRDSGERSVDGLYLRASRKPSTRQTLLVIGTDYKSPGSSKLTVCKGDVVSLISSHLKDWFWVRDRNGKEGFIPAAVAGHGFL